MFQNVLELFIIARHSSMKKVANHFPYETENNCNLNNRYGTVDNTVCRKLLLKLKKADADDGYDRYRAFHNG